MAGTGPCGLGVAVTQHLGRTALSHRVFTGLQRRRLGSLIAELAEAWMAAEEGRLHKRRGRSRLRAASAGSNHQLVFTDRAITTLVVLRFQLPHAALALLYGVDRSTITRAVHEVRPSWQLVASPFPDMATGGFALSRTSSPMRRLRMSSCGWTGQRSGFDAPGRASQAVAPTSRARCGRIPRRPAS